MRVDMFWKLSSFTNEALVKCKLLCHGHLKLFGFILLLGNNFFTLLGNTVAVLLQSLIEVMNCNSEAS